MYAKLVCNSNKGLKRVFTRKDKKMLSCHDLTSAVEITSRKTKTKKDGSVVLTLNFADGKAVEVTYRDLE